MRVAAAGARMRAEILEQPERWRDLVHNGRGAIDDAIELVRSADPELIVFAARGSSDHAAMYGQYLAHARLGIPAMLSTPAAVTTLGARLRLPRAVVIAVSQSGSSPDLIATVAASRDAGAVVVALTNDVRSPLATAADVHIDLLCGPERAVAATKSYTAELAALFLLISGWSGRDWDARASDLLRTADEVEAALARSDDAVDEVARLLTHNDRLLAVGRGFSMSSAREAALKLMETCAIPASGWSAADATHGPLGQVVPGTPVLAFTSGASGRPSVLAFAEAATHLGARVIRVDTNRPGHVLGLTPAGAADESLVPLTEIVPVQQVAERVAMLLGRDPDAPAGLRKVTRTT